MKEHKKVCFMEIYKVIFKSTHMYESVGHPVPVHSECFVLTMGGREEAEEIAKKQVQILGLVGPSQAPEEIESINHICFIHKWPENFVNPEYLKKLEEKNK